MSVSLQEPGSGVELARRAVACPGWRWMPGMRTSDGDRLSDRDIDVDVRVGLYNGALPDLYDPATLGCIENALVPEAWGGDVFVSIDTHLTRDGRVRTVVIVDADGEPEPGEWAASTKAEALVLSLESAGRREVAP